MMLELICILHVSHAMVDVLALYLAKDAQNTSAWKAATVINAPSVCWKATSLFLLLYFYVVPVLRVPRTTATAMTYSHNYALTTADTLDIIVSTIVISKGTQW